MRLRRSVLSEPGIVRKRRGKGFACSASGGTPLVDPGQPTADQGTSYSAGLEEGVDHAAPQRPRSAVGTDAAGRRQYSTIPRGTRNAPRGILSRVLELSTQLPAFRTRVAHDLADRGLTRNRVLALALRLLDGGYFRAGRRRVRGGARVLRDRHLADVST